MMKTLIPLALILAPAAIPLAAKAQPQSGPSVRVSYADLDLSRAADRTTLDRRLNRAIEQVCPTERPGYLTRSADGLRCQAITRQQLVEARQQALAQRGSAARIFANP